MTTKYLTDTDIEKKSFFSPKEREETITKYAYLVKYIAGRISVRLPSSVLFDELLSAGAMGLIDAADKFDPAKNVGFKTYAQYRIKGAILDELRSMDWYSRSMRKKIQNIENAVSNIEHKKGRPANDIEIAEELELTLEKYYKTLSEIHGATLLSLDSYIQNKSSGVTSRNTFQDGIKSDDSPTKNVMQTELKKVLTKAIKNLNEKEQLVISLYYYDEMTLKEIGKIMELTESRICQIHTMALIKLKTRMEKYQDGQ
jgi:RNA polymerase sigma factor for flagellar operon FliA